MRTPMGSFAATHVSALHGKAEAWFILSPGTVYLSLTRDLSDAELQSFVETQNIDALLSLMHEITVEPGDCIFVPHGVLHAIGAGILLAEVQEPEDLSILLEWENLTSMEKKMATWASDLILPSPPWSEPSDQRKT